MRFFATTKTWRGICFSALAFALAGCVTYQPPFTHHLEQRMTFAEVLRVAREKGYGNYCEIAEYKGHRLLRFRHDAGGEDVFLVVNDMGHPMLRTLEYGTVDEAQLVNFVEDLSRHPRQTRMSLIH